MGEEKTCDFDPEGRNRGGIMPLCPGAEHREAAATYAQVLNEKLLPQRDEELLQRQADALHLAGDYAESDRVCQRFQQT